MHSQGDGVLVIRCSAVGILPALPGLKTFAINRLFRCRPVRRRCHRAGDVSGISGQHGEPEAHKFLLVRVLPQYVAHEPRRLRLLCLLMVWLDAIFSWSR